MADKRAAPNATEVVHASVFFDEDCDALHLFGEILSGVDGYRISVRHLATGEEHFGMNVSHDPEGVHFFWDHFWRRIVGFDPPALNF